jgi:hypothetical protein
MILYISHRGNLSGRSHLENSPDYILEALNAGYNVEVDVWNLGGEWYLGHDEPQYRVKEDFLVDNRLWIHCKSSGTLFAAQQLAFLHGHSRVHYFWHQNDFYTLTSNGYIWTFPGQVIPYFKGIAVLPERSEWGIDHDTLGLKRAAGICSDYISIYI